MMPKMLFLTLLIEPLQHYLTPIAPWVDGDDGLVPLSSDFQDVTLPSLGGYPQCVRYL